jgi:putative protein kinase ArgK-like GTPase of G3E family
MISLMTLLKEAQSAPKAVILAGAPGAGKSSIVGDIYQEWGLLHSILTMTSLKT